MPSAFFQGALRLFELLALVQIAQFFEFLEQPRSHLALARFRILQQDPREFFMLPQQLFDVVLEFKLRVHQCPIMSRADEGEKSDQQFEFFAAKCDAQRSLRPAGPRRLKKKHGGRREQIFVVRRFGRGPIDRVCDGFQPGKRRVQYVPRSGPGVAASE